MTVALSIKYITITHTDLTEHTTACKKYTHKYNGLSNSDSK